MPRIRSIKPETPADKKLASVSRDARLTFIYTWTIADDDGLFRAEERQLLGQLYPHDEDISPETLRRLFGELTEIGVIRWRWTQDGCRIGEIVNWERHQQIKNRSKPFLRNELLPPSAEPPESLRRPSVDSGGAEPRVLSLESRVQSPESYSRRDADASGAVSKARRNGKPAPGGWPARIRELAIETHVGDWPEGRWGKALSRDFHDHPDLEPESHRPLMVHYEGITREKPMMRSPQQYAAMLPQLRHDLTPGSALWGTPYDPRLPENQP